MDDLISRKALTEKAWEADTQCGYVQVVDVGDIENAPAVDAAPVVHGRWEFKYEGTYRKRRSYCSVCGRRSGIGGIIENQKKPYCPNCGAKMEGGNDNGKAD